MYGRVGKSQNGNGEDGEARQRGQRSGHIVYEPRTEGEGDYKKGNETEATGQAGGYVEMCSTETIVVVAAVVERRSLGTARVKTGTWAKRSEAQGGQKRPQEWTKTECVASDGSADRAK